MFKVSFQVLLSVWGLHALALNQPVQADLQNSPATICAADRPSDCSDALPLPWSPTPSAWNGAHFPLSYFPGEIPAIPQVQDKGLFLYEILPSSTWISIILGPPSCVQNLLFICLLPIPRRTSRSFIVGIWDG
jgi:hypothetical protein